MPDFAHGHSTDVFRANKKSTKLIRLGAFVILVHLRTIINNCLVRCMPELNEIQSN